MANPLDIAEIVKVISIAFPNWKVEAQTADVYFRLLQDVPSDELKAAVLQCVSEPGRAFAPTIGEIRGSVSSLRQMSANVPSSYEAWQEVLQEFANTGSYGTPQFSNPLVGRAVDRLGWKQLCLSEDQTADRARFIQCYDRLLEQATTEDIMLPEVRGYIEANGARLMAPMESVHLLADKLNVNKPKVKK